MDHTQLCTNIPDHTAETIRAALEDADIPCHIVFAKHAHHASTPTTVHVPAEHLDRARGIADPILADARHRAAAAEPFLSPNQRLLAMLLPPAVFIISGIAGPSGLLAFGLVLLAIAIGVEIWVRRLESRSTSR